MGRFFSLGYSSGAAAPSLEAPDITYPSSDVTWYDYFTSVSLSPTNTGGTVTSYAVQSGTLPAGVSLNTSTGAITGTPTALKTDATVTIRATGPGGTSDFNISIEVLWGALATAAHVQGGDLRAGFSTRKQASDGTGDDADDADPVGYVSDLSGNGNHVIQATTSAKPTYDADGINGDGALLHDGGDFLQCATFAGGSETQPNTVWCVVKLGGLAGSYQFIIDGVASRNGLYRTTNWRMFAGSELDSGDAADNNLHLICGVFNGASSKQYLDGDEISSGDAGSSDMNGITVGADYNGWALSLNGTLIAAWGVMAGDQTANLGDLHTWAQAAFGTPS